MSFGTGIATDSDRVARPTRVPVSVTLSTTIRVPSRGASTFTTAACFAACEALCATSWTGNWPGFSNATSRSILPPSATSSRPSPKSQTQLSAFLTSAVTRNVAGATDTGETGCTAKLKICGAGESFAPAATSTGTDRSFSSARKFRTVSLTV